MPDDSYWSSLFNHLVMYLSYDYILGSIAADLDTKYVFNSYTMGTSGLPNIYT